MTEPGLYFKVPLLQNVRFFDKRILTLDAPDAERFLTSEKKNVLVDSFVKWRIVDVRQYYVSGARRRGARAETRLSQTVNDGPARGVRQAHRARSGVRRARQDHGGRARQGGTRTRSTIGVEIVDVRLKRVDLVAGDQRLASTAAWRPSASASRTSCASTGAAERREDPGRRRQAARGDHRRGLSRRAARQGRGRRARRRRSTPRRSSENPEFYAFYRSLEAYRASFRSKSDVMVLDPNSDFFRYLKSPGTRRGRPSQG